MEDPDEPVFPVCLPLKPGKAIYNYNNLEFLLLMWILDQPKPGSEHVVMGWGRTNNERGDNGNTSTSGSFTNIQQNLVVPEVKIMILAYLEEKYYFFYIF